MWLLRHNGRLASLPAHPPGLIPFPFALGRRAIPCFLFSLFFLKNNQTGQEAKGISKQNSSLKIKKKWKSQEEW